MCGGGGGQLKSLPHWGPKASRSSTAFCHAAFESKEKRARKVSAKKAIKLNILASLLLAENSGGEEAENGQRQPTSPPQKRVAVMGRSQ